MRSECTALEEAVLLSVVAKEASKMREREQEILAEMITEKVVEAWNKGQKKGKGKK